MQAQWRAPGRVNLIGEHTDYNDGFALPFALDAACVATVSRSAGDTTTVRSAQEGGAREGGAHEFTDADLRPDGPAAQGWTAYVAGAVWVLRQLGHEVPALRIEVDSSVPVGAGLSSSAALVCSVTGAIGDLLELGLGADELLAATRRVENDFVGAPTGGMDQLASLRARAGHALFCDMRSLATEQVPFAPADAGLTVLVIDSHAEHRHSDGEYGRRREGCTRAAQILGVDALRDVPLDGLDDALDRLPDDELRRYVRHVVTEDERVLGTVRLLRSGDVGAIGPLLTASHVSMRDDYRITVPPLDVAVDTLLGAGALGARMTGGGFGGCVIALIPAELAQDAAAAVRDDFARRGFTAPTHFTVVPAAGAGPV